MKRTFFNFILLFLILTGNVFGSLQDQGTLDSNRNHFYYTNIDRLVWSGYKEEFRDNYHTIYQYDLKTKQNRIFFYSDCSFVLKPKLSPRDDYLGALCELKKRLNSLIIINLKGEKVIELSESVQEYAWHPDGNKIIYMTGSITYRGDDKVIIPTGIWLYDIKNKTKAKIAKKGWNIRSVSFDKHIYFWDGKKTVRYNVDTQKIEETTIKEKVDYSPNGRYYVYYKDGEDPMAWEAPYWSPFRIFDTKNNKDLPPEKIGFLSERNPTSIVWGKDSRKIAFSGYIKRTVYNRLIYIYDLEANQLIKQFEGRIVGYDKDRTVLVIYRDGQFYIEGIPVAKRLH